MAKNMFCPNQKANSKEFRDNFDRIFRGKESVSPEYTKTLKRLRPHIFKTWGIGNGDLPKETMKTLG